MKQKFFISYRRSEAIDQRLARFLVKQLTSAGHETFIDESMPAGADWIKEIEQAIDKSDVLIVLLSEQSMHSEMVQGEIRRAHHRQRPDGCPRILPVRIKYEGSLGYELDSYLGRINYVLWREVDDDERVLAEILGQKKIIQETTAPSPSPGISITQPIPAMDPRALLASVGGTMAADDPYYVRRPADEQVMTLAREIGRTLIIKAPRQMGKSSLLCRYLAECRSVAKAIAYIDFQRFPDNTLSDYASFLVAFADELFYALDFPVDTPLSTSITQHKFIRFVRDELLTRIDGPVVFAFDEVDRVLGRPWQGDFFAMLRSWHNDRATNCIWRTVDLALVISTEPYLLIDRVDQSPFNVVSPTVLGPFDSSEMDELNVKYGSPLSSNDVALLKDFLNGHPYLVRLAFHKLGVIPGLTVGSLTVTGTRDDGPFADHLRAKLFAIQQDSGMVKALKKLIVTQTPLDQMTYWRLHGAGLVLRNAEGSAVPFNQLYARFFREIT